LDVYLALFLWYLPYWHHLMKIMIIGGEKDNMFHVKQMFSSTSAALFRTFSLNKY